MICGSSGTEGLRRAGKAFLATLLLASCSPQEAGERISLKPGTGFYRTLSGGKAHRFRFESAADQLLHLTVEQHGIDVLVLLKDSSGRLLYEVDTPSGKEGPETVLAVTPTAGEYTLVVEPFVEEGEGAFTLTVREARPAGKADRLRAAAAGVYARAERRRLEEKYEQAIPGLREAVVRFDALGQRDAAARARWHLGESLLETGRLTPAAAVLEEAAIRFRGLGDGLDEARVLNDLGEAWRLLGEPGKAIQAFERSLRLYAQAGNRSGQASALGNLGLALEKNGDLQGAIERYEQAFLLWRQLEKPAAQAATLQNLGSLYILIGHDAEGMDLLARALELLEDGKDSDRIPVLIAVGWAHYLAGRPDAALGFYREAIALSRRLEDRMAEAGAWDRRGSALRALHRYDEAAASYSRSLEMSRAIGSPVNQAHTLANLGGLDLEIGKPERARLRLRESLKLFETSGDPNGETFVRIALSRADRILGDLGSAREQIDVAVRQVEEMRAGLLGSRSRGQFLATRYDAYEELVALLMELHRREPEAGHAREALEVAERARARNLSEDLAGGGSLSRKAGEGRGGGSERRRTLQAELRSLEERRQALALQDRRDPRLRIADAQLRELGMELDRLAAAGPRQPGFTPLTATRIQGLAGESTVLVVYLLSEPVSFAWTVDRAGIEAHLLPARGHIENLARRMVAAMSRKNGVAAQGTATRAARELSDAILAPLRERLAGGRRLAILADGALHLVPFAALPEPAAAQGEMAEPLLVEHEILLLPSAAFLDQQRRRLAGRRPAPGAVAVLADPVFSANDDRLPRGRGEGGAAGARGFQPAGPFERLRYTGQEAREILRLAPGKETLLAMGPDADRDLVLSGTLGRFRIVHFATHGLLHPVLPERSGIVLSLYDARGRRRDGFLSAPDVAGLDLPAELVVLSACQTGLGREMRGEGLVGLTQAFFRAGARRVVVSHWSVQDRATAELMARFYRGLLAERLPPAAALRAAQLSIRSEAKWSAPCFWAGFSLHGDWQ